MQNTYHISLIYGTLGAHALFLVRQGIRAIMVRATEVLLYYYYYGASFGDLF